MSSETTSPRSAAITGAGGGLGKDMAIALAVKGYRVFGTALVADEVQELERATNGAVRLTVCDITDADDVRAWTEDVDSAVGDGGLDVGLERSPLVRRVGDYFCWPSRSTSASAPRCWRSSGTGSQVSDRAV